MKHVISNLNRTTHKATSTENLTIITPNRRNVSTEAQHLGTARKACRPAINTALYARPEVGNNGSRVASTGDKWALHASMNHAETRPTKDDTNVPVQQNSWKAGPSQGLAVPTRQERSTRQASWAQQEYSPRMTGLRTSVNYKNNTKINSQYFLSTLTWGSGRSPAFCTRAKRHLPPAYPACRTRQSNPAGNYNAGDAAAIISHQILTFPFHLSCGLSHRWHICQSGAGYRRTRNSGLTLLMRFDAILQRVGKGCRGRAYAQTRPGAQRYLGALRGYIRPAIGKDGCGITVFSS